MSIAVVILAGGEGRRIGGAKPMRQLGGQSLIQRALLQAQQWSDTFAVCVREPDQLPGVTATLLTDEPGVGGPLAGLVSGRRFALERACDHLLTIPADMPFLPGDLAERLVAAIGAFGAAVARSAGHLHPVCCLWRVPALGRLDDYVATGKRSLHGLAEAATYVAVDWASQPRDPFFNINSEADLAEAERLLGS